MIPKIKISGLIISAKNKHRFLNEYLFISNFVKILENRKVYTSEVTLKSENLISINISLFFSSSYLIEFQYLLGETRANKKKIIDLYALINKEIKNLLFTFNNKIIIKRENLILYLLTGNTIEKLKIIKEVFSDYKKSLFTRQHFHFIDFLKTTHLFLNKKTHLYLYIRILGRIFKYLHKRNHSKYFTFIRDLMNFIVNKNIAVKGLKFQIQGRLQAKERAESYKIVVGKIPSNTSKSNIVYEKLSVETPYGVYGLKMFVNYYTNYYEC